MKKKYTSCPTGKHHLDPVDDVCEPYFCPTCDPDKEGIGCAGHSRSLKEELPLVKALTETFGRCKDHLDPDEGECMGCMSDKLCTSLEYLQE